MQYLQDLKDKFKWLRLKVFRDKVSSSNKMILNTNIPVFEKEKVSDIILGLTTEKILMDMRTEILEEYKKQQTRKDLAKPLSKESRSAIDCMYILQTDLKKVEQALIQAKGIGDKIRKDLEKDLGLQYFINYGR